MDLESQNGVTGLTSSRLFLILYNMAFSSDGPLVLGVLFQLMEHSCDRITVITSNVDNVELIKQNKMGVETSKRKIYRVVILQFYIEIVLVPSVQVGLRQSLCLSGDNAERHLCRQSSAR